MANTIKIKRGLKANLPTLAAGELAHCTDTNELFVGTASGNQKIVPKITVGTTAPSNPSVNDLWVDTN